jgi:hypothetical protein
VVQDDGAALFRAERGESGHEIDGRKGHLDRLIQQLLGLSPVLQLTPSDLERGTPHPPLDVSDLVTSAKSLGERFRNGITRDLAIAGEQEHSAPDLVSSSAVATLNGVVVDHASFSTHITV